jgi:hypothetical protein
LRRVSIRFTGSGHRNQLFRHGKKGFCVLVWLVEKLGSVARHPNQFSEDRLEVLDAALGKRIDALHTRHPPFLTPQR